VLTDLSILRAAPEHIRSDNGPEFIARAVREWIAAVGAQAAFIKPGSPWENGPPWRLDPHPLRAPGAIGSGGEGSEVQNFIPANQKMKTKKVRQPSPVLQ